MKTLSSGVVAALLSVILHSPAFAQTPPAPEKVSPEEATKRKDWNDSMLRKTSPKKGCFRADYPSTDWKEVACVPAPNHPAIPSHGPRPSVVGNTNDISAQAPAGHITQAIGSFDSVTNVTSESGPIANSGPPVADAYSLQINTDRFGGTVCNGSPNAACNDVANTGCCGWQQFVFYNSGSPGTTGSLFIQDWILRYNTTCPAGQGWQQFSFTGDTDIYCYQNVRTSDPADMGATAVDNQPITNLHNLRMSVSVGSSGDSATLSTGGTTAYNRTVNSLVNTASSWTIAEWNVFGPLGSSSGGALATFNTGASIVPRTEIIYGGTAAPICSTLSFTGETNNLSFGPTAPAATAPGPAVIFSESSAGGATSFCAAAATIGDTHLATLNGLFYDFQASGDFVLAQVEPNFTVQTRQASGAPQWPDAAVNKAVAARIGKTQVAVCLGPSNDRQQGTLFIDGKETPLGDDKSMSLADGVGVSRQGSVYFITSAAGDSVRAEVNSTWINVNVGLGHWPAPARGLIANANGNVNQIETRDHFVLTNPFPFDELYHRFADSWRVPADESMLSVCGREWERGIPTRPFYANDLDPGLRDRARAVCTAAGVKPGALLDACTLDVAVLGNNDAAKVFVNANPPVAVGTIVGATGGGGVLGLGWWLWLLIIIAVIVLIVIFRRRK